MQTLNRFLIVAAVALLPVASTAQVAAPLPVIVKTLSFEPPQALNYNAQLLEGSRTYSYTRDNTRAVSGSYSICFRLLASDPEVQWGSKRAELTVVNNTITPDTTIKAYSWAVYMDSATYLPATNEETFSQWHDKAIPPYTGSASPTMEFQTINGRYRVKVRYSLTHYQVTSARKNYPSHGNGQDLGPILYNQWVYWDVIYLPRTDATGIIRVFKNGVEVFSYYGPNTFVGCYNPPYWKIGVYKWQWMQAPAPGQPTERKLWFDMVRVGRSLDPKDISIYGPPPPAENQAPTAIPDPAYILLKTTTSTVIGVTGSDTDGTITGYAWTKIEGPAGDIISNSAIQRPTVSNLTPGATYKYQCTVTDNGGKTASAIVSVEVNKPPVVDLSLNTGTMINPDGQTATISLLGGGPLSGDEDGTITAWQWTQKSGPSGAVIQTPDAINTVITNMRPGYHTFVLTATDDNGAKGSQEITIFVRTGVISTPVGNGSALPPSGG